VIDKFTDLHELRQRFGTTNMVAVKMRRDKVIEAIYARVRHRCNNTFGVSVIWTAKAGVHEDGFACGCHDQRRCPAVGVYPIDIQSVLLRLDIKSEATQHDASA
jgi:hypothetical protein